MVASDANYARAFDKLFRDPQFGHREFTGPESDAFQRAQQLKRAMAIGATSTGGALLPTHLDPAIIVSSGSSAKNPIGDLCSTAIIATNTWNGVSAGLVEASFDAEATEVSDDSPTLAQPSIATGKLQGFIPVSIEAMEDTTISSQVGALFAESFDWLIGQEFTVGAGSNGPTGIVTALAGGAQEIPQAAGEAITRADAYALQEALAPRWRSNAKWQMSLPILNEFRQFPRLTSGTEVPLVEEGGDYPSLLGWDVRVNDNMAAGYDPAVTASDAVAIAGDWTRYQAVFRVGTTVELISHLFGAAGRPTGQRGFYCYAPVGGAPTVESAFTMLTVTTAA